MIFIAMNLNSPDHSFGSANSVISFSHHIAFSLGSQHQFISGTNPLHILHNPLKLMTLESGGKAPWQVKGSALAGSGAEPHEGAYLNLLSGATEQDQ